MTERALSKKELLREMGITDRLLKFWVNWYKLPVNRRGRGSNYPHETVQTLRIIKRLADSKYFTMRFVRDLLVSRGGNTSSSASETPTPGAAERLIRMETHLELCRDVLNGARAARAGARMPAAREAALPGSAPPAPQVPTSPTSAVAPAIVSWKKISEDLL